MKTCVWHRVGGFVLLLGVVATFYLLGTQKASADILPACDTCDCKGVNFYSPDDTNVLGMFTDANTDTNVPYGVLAVKAPIGCNFTPRIDQNTTCYKLSFKFTGYSCKDGLGSVSQTVAPAQGAKYTVEAAIEYYKCTGQL